MKVKAFIASIACIIIVGVIAILLYCFWPAIKGTVDNSKYYTAEDLQEAYDKGYDDGCKTETELTGQVEYYKQLVDDYYLQVNRLNDEISSLNENIGQKDDEISNLTNSKQMLEGNIATLQDEIKQKNATIEENNVTISSLEQQIKELKNNEKDKTKEVEKLKEEIEELKKLNSQLQTIIDNHTNTIASLNSQIQFLNNQIDQLKGENENSKAQIASLNSQIAMLNDSIEKYKQEIENYKQIIEELKKLNACVVTFSVDGQIISTQQVNKTESPEYVEVPQSESYIFDYWTIDGNDGEVDPFTYSVVEDMQFVAKIRKYKIITFTVDDRVVSTQNIMEDSELQLPDTPQKEHYNFLGWSIDGENVIEISEYKFTHDTNLIAVFEVTGVLPYTFSGTRLTSYTGNESEIVIPSSYSIVENNIYVEGTDYNVTSIEDEAFKSNKDIVSVVIPNCITSIGQEAFRLCSNLKNLTIGEGVRTIEKMAFAHCKNLSEVHFNAINLTYTSEYSYIFSCSSSGSDDTSVYGIAPFKLIVGAKVEQIPKYLFAAVSPYTTNIGSVEFEEGSVCSKIYSYAFAGNYGTLPLKELELPESLKTIEDYAFYNCQNISKIYFNSVEMNDMDGYIPTKMTYRFYKLGGKAGTEVVVGNKAKYIPAGLFMRYGNGLKDGETANITKLSFEENSICEEIRQYAFHGCVNLVDIILPNSLKLIGDNAFSYCNNINFNIYDNGQYLGTSENQYYYLYRYINADAINYTVHNQARYIQGSAFNSKVENITIEGVNTEFVNGFAIKSKYYLKSITVNPDNLYYTVVDNVLYTKDKSTLLAFPANVYAEDGSDISFLIPDFVETIARSAFVRCWNLKELFIPSSVTLIEEYAFSDNQSLKTVIIESAYAYNSASSLLSYATTVKVLKTIVDDEANTNEKLSDTSKYTKTSEGNYYIFTKVS